MKKVEYILKIYKPKSADDVWIIFNSPNPFMRISVGDIIDPGIWPETQSPMKVLRVLNVEHQIWEDGETLKHMMSIFTDEVAGTRDLRINPS